MSSHYVRVSTESDENNEEEALQLHTLSLTKEKEADSENVVYNKKRTDINFWNTECICRLISLFVLLLIALGFGISRVPVHSFHSHPHTEEEHHHLYTSAAVAAGQAECSEVGVGVLKEGGNAVDAAIATLLCQGVVEPHFCGIGKYLWGQLKGYSYAYKKYGGGVKWARLFEPAIHKARAGFYVSGGLAAKLQQNKLSVMQQSTLCELYCNNAKNDVIKEGELVKNTKLADTLEKVKENGHEVFYSSPMVDQFVHDINKHGGNVSKDDFVDYTVIERTTLHVPLANTGLTLIVPPLPSGGPILSIIMRVMDTYKITPKLFASNKALHWHRVVESFKHAFGYRTRFGDPKFNPGVNHLVSNLLSEKGILNITSKILDNQTFHDPAYYGAMVNEGNSESSTSHLSVLSPSGDAVSVTSTINYHFGSFVMSPTTGVLFNNEMNDFSTQDSIGPNKVEPGKRPQSSMSPCVLVDSTTQEVVYIFGAAGGKRIPTAVAISLIRLLYFGTNDFDDAIQLPRLHHRLIPDVLMYEEEFDQNILNQLRALGHNLASKPNQARSEVNGIKNHVDHIHAYSDARNEGAKADGW
ncbi:scoloptoxin SSD14-like [Ciona intestinalis]